MAKPKPIYGPCKTCKFWMIQVDGPLKPCTRLNSNKGEVDIILEGNNLPPEKQHFSVPANFGCPLYQPAEENKNRGVAEIPGLLKTKG